MPYWLESDTFADDPIWDVLAEGRADRVDALQAAYARLKAKASHLLTDGYLTEQTALRYCRRQVLDRLTTRALDRPPLIHQRGDKCECLGDTWIDGYAYRIHGFLKRNPSRREYNRNVAQRRDLADPRLKAMVYARDGGCCRYCRSGPLSPKAGRSRDRRKVLSYDHVDPDAPAGTAGTNLVVACGRCNEFKGRRTPDEADMVLLPVPTAEEIAAWRERGQQLFDRPPYPGPRPDHGETSTEPRPEQKQNQKQTTDPPPDPNSDPTSGHNAGQAGPVRPTATTPQPDQRSEQPPEGSGTGRGGPPAPVPSPPPPWAGQPARTPEYPDVYHRRSRAPSTANPHPLPQSPPDFIWPPGSVPARPDRTTSPQESP